MKKLLTAWILLAAFLIGAYVYPTSTNKTTSSSSSSTKTTSSSSSSTAATSNKKVKIGILQLMSHPALNEIRKGIIAGLKQSGYVVGKNLTIDYQNAQNDQSNLTSMAQRFKSEHVNLTVGIATSAVQTLANTFTKSSGTAVVMAGISDPVGSKLVKSLNKPGGNVTGTRHKEPIAKQVALIKKLTPNVKTVGIIYTSSDDSSKESTKEFAAAAKKAGLKVKYYSITSTSDITQTASNAVNHVDAIYVPTDNTVASGVQALLKVTNAAKIPVYAAAATMVKQGAFATVAVSQYEIGVQTGKMAAAILKGKDPATYAVQTPAKTEYAINITTAKKLGISVSSSFLKLVKQKGVIYK